MHNFTWGKNRYAQHHAQGTAPGGKSDHSNHLRQPRKWQPDCPQGSEQDSVCAAQEAGGSHWSVERFQCSIAGES